MEATVFSSKVSSLRGIFKSRLQNSIKSHIKTGATRHLPRPSTVTAHKKRDATHPQPRPRPCETESARDMLARPPGSRTAGGGRGASRSLGPGNGMARAPLSPSAPFSASRVHLVRTRSTGPPPARAPEALPTPARARLPPRPVMEQTRHVKRETDGGGPLGKSLTAASGSGGTALAGAGLVTTKPQHEHTAAAERCPSPETESSAVPAPGRTGSPGGLALSRSSTHSHCSPRRSRRRAWA